MVSVRAVEARKRLSSCSTSGSASGSRVGFSPPGVPLPPPGQGGVVSPAVTISVSPVITSTPAGPALSPIPVQVVNTASPITPPVRHHSSGSSSSIRHVRSVSTLAPLSKVKVLLEKGHDNINKLSKFDIAHCCDPEFTHLVTTRAGQFMPRCDLRKLPLFWVQACSVEYFNKLPVDYAAIRDEWLSMDRRGKEAYRMYAGARSSSSSASASFVITSGIRSAGPELARADTPGSAEQPDKQQVDEPPPVAFKAEVPVEVPEMKAPEEVSVEERAEVRPMDIDVNRVQPEHDDNVAEQEVMDPDKEEDNGVRDYVRDAEETLPGCKVDDEPPGFEFQKEEDDEPPALEDEPPAPREEPPIEDDYDEPPTYDDDEPPEDDQDIVAAEDVVTVADGGDDDDDEYRPAGGFKDEDQAFESEDAAVEAGDNRLPTSTRPGKALGVRDLSRLAPLADVRPLLFANNPWCRKFDIKYCSDPQFAEALAHHAETYLGPTCDLGKLPAYIVQASYVAHFMNRNVDFAALRDDWLFHRGGKAGREKLEEEAAVGYSEKRPPRPKEDVVTARGVSSADRFLFKRDKGEEFNSDDGFQPKKRRRRSSKRPVEDLNVVPVESPPLMEESEKAVEAKTELEVVEARCRELEAKVRAAEARCREMEAWRTPGSTVVDGMDTEPMEQGVEPMPKVAMSTEETEVQRRCREAVARCKAEAEADMRARMHEVESRCRMVADARCREIEGKCKREAKDALARYKKESDTKIARAKKQAEDAQKQAETKLKEIAEEGRSSSGIKPWRRMEIVPTERPLDELRGEPLAESVFDKETRNKQCPMCSQRFTSEGWYTLGTCGHQYHLQCLLLHAYYFCSCAVCHVGLPCEFYRTVGHESFVE